ncbi:MAG: DUF3231 family protein [Peptococcaceae bacterium]|nr:DUF3231 family protein [Peptococcaceae bacterium]
MDMANILHPIQKNKLHWGESLGLWDIARFKIIGLTISEIFLAQAKDEDLKKSLSAGVEMLIVPHLEKIQKFLHKEGLEVPAVPPRKNLDIIGKQIEPNTFIEDDEIANDIREIYRYGLYLNMKALSASTRDDVRELVWGILVDDYKGFDAMIKLHRKKKWLVLPPTI